MVQPIITGIVAAITGFSSSFAIVLAGLAAVGATDGQAASGLLVMCVLQGLLSIALSLRFRVPLKFAWSTPGAALLVSTAGLTGNFAEAVGAFVVAGALIALTGLWPLLGRLVTRIPRPLANAMLAGILIPICLAPVTAAVEIPALALPVIVVWAVLYKLAPRWAVPAAIVLAGVLLALTSSGVDLAGNLLPRLEYVAPEFDPVMVLSIALPLYIVTMAGQNIPGIAVVGSFGFDAHPRASITGSGALSIVGALFGGSPINLAALTAALTAGPEAAAEKSQRYIAAVAAGVGYVVLGLFAGVATSFVSSSPPELIQAVAGLALLGALIGAIVAAVERTDARLAAVATLLVTASSISIAGVGSAFWGLLVGLLLWGLTVRRVGALQ